MPAGVCRFLPGARRLDDTLLLTPGGWFVAAGSRVIGGYSDFALAQYDPNGVMPDPGPRRPWGKTFID
jgi:hypothetical protein